jgi:ABC-2 type transport system ATP-binding protein
VLKAQNISRRFGATFALQDVTFTVRRGEILGLIGPNGAGKTTLLEILSGLLPADMGSVLWDDTLLHPARRKQVMFYLPEAVYPYPDRRAIDVLALFAHLFAQPNERLVSIVGDLALSPVLATRVAALSKGYRRRLLLAIGLLAPQPLIMIDEPFEGLDLRQTRDIMEVLRRRRAADRTLLLSIHQLSDAERLCDRFVLLSGGSVRGEGDLPELRRRAGSGQAGLEEVFLALT